MKPEDNKPVIDEATAETDYILKVQVGIVVPFKARGTDDAMAVAKRIAEDFDSTMQQFDPKPDMVHIINGDIMTADDFEKMKEHARQQADALKQLLGAVKQAADNLGMDVQIPQLDEGDDKQPEAPAGEGSEGAVVDAIEPSEGAVLVPGSRTLN